MPYLKEQCKVGLSQVKISFGLKNAVDHLEETLHNSDISTHIWRQGPKFCFNGRGAQLSQQLHWLLIYREKTDDQHSECVASSKVQSRFK